MFNDHHNCSKMCAFSPEKKKMVGTPEERKPCRTSFFLPRNRDEPLEPQKSHMTIRCILFFFLCEIIKVLAELILVLFESTKWLGPPNGIFFFYFYLSNEPFSLLRQARELLRKMCTAVHPDSSYCERQSAFSLHKSMTFMAREAPCGAPMLLVQNKLVFRHIGDLVFIFFYFLSR